MLEKMFIRLNTPMTRPTTESEEDGTCELTVKTYFPNENQSGSAFSSFLHELESGEQLDVCGPTGEITYQGNGTFTIEGKKQRSKQVSLMPGGSGITAGATSIKRIVEEIRDRTHIAVTDANQTEYGILLREELNAAVEKSKQMVNIMDMVSHPRSKAAWEWKGASSGHVNADMIKKELFGPSENSVVFLCKPPGMIQKAALPALKGQFLHPDQLQHAIEAHTGDLRRIGTVSAARLHCTKHRRAHSVANEASSSKPCSSRDIYAVNSICGARHGKLRVSASNH